MSAPALWLSFLESVEDGPAPRLRMGPEPDAAEIELTDRARWVLAAIALPRELAPESASDPKQRARLGSRTWSSGEITHRIPYQHRSTIRLALNDLRTRLGERGLVLEDLLLIETDRGRYAVRGGRIAIDVVELYELRSDAEAFDRRLELAVGDRTRARLAPVCAHLIGETALRDIELAIGTSAVRAVGSPSSSATSPAADVAAEMAALEAAIAQASPAGTESPVTVWPVPRRRRGTLLIRGLAALVAVAVVAALIPMLASGGHRRIHALGPPRHEVSGGVAHTWSNPKLAGGRGGPEIMPGQSVLIACRLKGFKVPDGNVWWYLLASAPWSHRFYATADTFYNNGHTQGTLRGSKFVDLKVARCS